MSLRATIDEKLQVRRVKLELESAREEVKRAERRVKASAGQPGPIRIVAASDLLDALRDFHNRAAVVQEWVV